jgi:predicted RNase H-like nuclease (RuvC/YqgF family)
MEIDKYDAKLDKMQNDLGTLNNGMTAMQKDIEHLTMKLDSFVVANNERINDLYNQFRELQNKTFELEKKLIWASGVAFALATVISYAIRFIPT